MLDKIFCHIFLCSRVQSSVFTYSCHFLEIQGKYEESASYIEKAYKLTKKIQEEGNKELVRTEYGIVIANLVMFGLNQAMNTTSTQNIDKLLNWKQSRKDVFAACVSIPRNFSLEKVVGYRGSDEDINVEQESEQHEVVNDVTETEQDKTVDTDLTNEQVLLSSRCILF